MDVWAAPVAPLVLAAVVETGDDGRAVWEWPPEALLGMPVLSALPAAEDGTALMPLLEVAAPGRAVVLVLRLDGATSAPAVGVAVHVTAQARG